VADNLGSGNISVFEIAHDGVLTLIPRSPFTPMSEPIGMKVSPNGQFLAVSEPLLHGVEMFSILRNGSLVSIGGFPSSGFSHDVDIDCSSRLLYATGFDNNETSIVDAYTISTNGSLTLLPTTPFITTSSGLSANILLSPDGSTLFVDNNSFNSSLNTNPQTISVFHVNPDGSLSPLPNSPITMNGNVAGAGGMTINRNMNLLYVADDGVFDVPHSAISIFQIGVDGSLTEVPGSPFLLRGPIGVRSLASYPELKKAELRKLCPVK
jgi:6-phosphogluconolactonase (cycloisomerase 2 family)